MRFVNTRKTRGTTSRVGTRNSHRRSPKPLMHDPNTPKIITYTFPCCWVHIDEDASFLHTAFDSGRILEAVVDEKKDTDTAQRYGYGSNVWRLWREHDVLHHTVGTLFGHGVSPTIWSVAHMDSPEALPLWVRLEEEGFIADIHRWLNLDLWEDNLSVLCEFGIPILAMQSQLRDILAGRTLDVAEAFGSLSRNET
jgi:hypothetical protein